MKKKAPIRSPRTRKEVFKLSSAKVLHALLASTPDALIIVDRFGTILFANTQTERLYSYTHGELIGKQCMILLPEQYRDTHLFYQEQYLTAPVSRPMGEGIEIFGLRKNGTTFPAEIHISPLITEQGTVVMASIRDITRRKTTERQVRIFSQAVQSMHEGVIITDLENRILSVNPALLSIYGYTNTDLLGGSLEELFPHGFFQRVMNEIIDRAVKGGWEGELINIRKNGEEFPVYFSTSVVNDQRGGHVAFVSVVRDISEQKRIQQQLELASRQHAEDTRHFTLSIQRAQEEERRRIARELHDGLSQRLSGIKLHMELLGTEFKPGDKKVGQRIKKIKKQINDMIIETHRISVNLHPTTLDDFGLTAALQLLFKEFEATFSIPITYHPSISTHERVDRYVEIALYRITQEALNNISKHSGATGITIWFTCDTNGFFLSIEDNGRGFDFQNRTKRSGLGLISMRERTENVGGTFTVVSEAGRGTKISVTIPVTKE